MNRSKIYQGVLFFVAMVILGLLIVGFIKYNDYKNLNLWHVFVYLGGIALAIFSAVVATGSENINLKYFLLALVFIIILGLEIIFPVCDWVQGLRLSSSLLVWFVWMFVMVLTVCVFIGVTEGEFKICSVKK